MRADDLLNELSYKKNIGAIETFKFFQVASPEQKVELKRLLADKKYEQAWDLIQSVTGVKLQGLGTKNKKPQAETRFSEYERAVMEGGHSLDQPVAESAIREAVLEACWKDYKQIGMKRKNGKTVPNCVPKKGVAEDELEEGWKDTLGNLAIAGAIGAGGAGGMAAKDAFNKWQSSGSTPAATAPAPQQQSPVAKSAIAHGVQKAQDAKKAEQPKPKEQKPAQLQVKNITDHPMENVLRKVAQNAGLAGVELAAFMAQCAHETLDFKRLTEFGGKLDFKKYDPKFAPKKAKALGNKHAGDGERYKGRGFIQITGRWNYKKAGEELGLPLEQKPELVEDPKIAAQVAVWFWKHRVQPNVDNFNDIDAVTKMINPGMRGLADRVENFKDYLGNT